MKRSKRIKLGLSILGYGLGASLGLWQGCSPTASLRSAASVQEDGRYPVFPPGRHDSLPLAAKVMAASAGELPLPEAEWTWSLPQKQWAGNPALVAVRLPERSWRISLYETRFAAKSFTQGDCDFALAYLFKLDAQTHDSSASETGRLRLYLPPEPGRPHLGLGYADDTTLAFFYLESSDTSAMPALLDWARKASEAGLIRPPEKRAARSSAFSAANSTFLAAIENTLGLRATEDSAYGQAAQRFSRAFSLDSLNPRYLANIAAMDQAQKRSMDGIKRIKDKARLLEETEAGDLWGVLGGLYEELGDYEQARQCAIKALEKDPDNREWLINLSDALWGLGERVQSKNVLLNRYEQQPDFRLSVYLAGTYLGLEEYENARKVLDATHEQNPSDAKSVEYALRAQIGLKDYAAAQAYAHSFGESHQESAIIRFLMAVIAFNLKQYRSALGEVQASLKLDPSHREAQELSTQITALLGGKSNHILRTPIPPLKTALSLKEARGKVKDPQVRALMADFPLTLVDQDIAFSWTPGSRWRKTRHQLFHIPDGRRLLQFSELNYELNPTVTRFYVNRFRLYDSTMKVLNQGKPSDFYVTGNHNTTLHPENLLVHLPIKARHGGHFLEVMTTEEAQVPAKEFPYLRHEQQAIYPILKTRFDILHPPPNLLVSPRGDCVLDSLPDRLRLVMDTPIPPLDRRYFSSPPEFSTGFSVSAFTTWREVGKGYWEGLGQAGIHPDSLPFSVRERAGEVVGGKRGKTPVQALQALFAFVRDSIRYNNYEFSLQAQIPAATDIILQKGQADCKGLSLLLLQMLQSVGYSANLFLVNLDHPGEPEHPNLNQFNHMIVYVPPQKGQMAAFLDPSEKFMAFRRAPLNLEGRIGLIVDRENSRVAAIPEIDSTLEHQALVFHRLDIGEAGLAHGVDSVVLHGKLAAWFREHYHEWNAATRMQTLMSWMSEGYPPFVERGFRITHAENPDQPLTLVFRYETRFHMPKNQREIEHFPKIELSFLRFPPPRLCRQPVHFAHELVIQSEWVYHLPKGYFWKTTDIDREVNAAYLHWKFSIQQNIPESIRIRQHWRVDPFVATPEEYGRSYTEWSPILARAGLRLIASKP